jgi:hypothetical protein
MFDAYATVNFLGIVGALCAAVMVGWALFLIQSRIITLQSAPSQSGSDPELSVQIQKALKVQVQSSVIALFAVAVAFLGLSFYYVQGNRPRHVLVHGEIQSEDNAVVTISLSTQWQTLQTSGGEVRGEIWPERVDFVTVDIATPGHEPGQIIIMAQRDDSHNGELFFKPVKIGRKVVDKPQSVAQPTPELAPLR